MNQSNTNPKTCPDCGRPVWPGGDAPAKGTCVEAAGYLLTGFADAGPLCKDVTITNLRVRVAELEKRIDSQMFVLLQAPPISVDDERLVDELCAKREAGLKARRMLSAAQQKHLEEGQLAKSAITMNDGAHDCVLPETGSWWRRKTTENPNATTIRKVVALVVREQAIGERGVFIRFDRGPQFDLHAFYEFLEPWVPSQGDSVTLRRGAGVRFKVIRVTDHPMFRYQLDGGGGRAMMASELEPAQRDP